MPWWGIDVDPVTGMFGMIAGGATGLALSLSSSAPTNAYVVAQYLRVALVVLTMPLVVTYLFTADTTVQTTSMQRIPAWRRGGWARRFWWRPPSPAPVSPPIRLPIPATLGPLLLTAA